MYHTICDSYRKNFFLTEIYFLEDFWLQGRGPALRKLVACHKALTLACSAGLSRWGSGQWLRYAKTPNFLLFILGCPERLCEKDFVLCIQFLPQENSCDANRKLPGESAEKNAAEPGPLQLTWVHLTHDPRVTSRVHKVKTSCSPVMAPTCVHTHSGFGWVPLHVYTPTVVHSVSVQQMPHFP